MHTTHTDHDHHHHDTVHASKKYKISQYIPLLVVFAFIAITSTTHVTLVGSTFMNWMNATMGYFFLYFALFKFIDLPGFKEGYAHYDVLAKRVPLWGYIYPFVELALGVLYVLGVQSSALYIVTIAITLLNVVSVALKLSKKEVFMCACLGTVLKVPLTTVTLIEYGLMGAMAVAMLVL
jgi:hypothetical protein